MLHWQQQCFISSLLSVPPMQLASGISALAFLEDHWNYRTQKDPTSLSVYNTCNTASCQQWHRTSEMHVSFKRTGSHDPHHLHHFQRKGNRGFGWIFCWFPVKSEGHAATFPLLQCFCITSGRHLYWLPKQRLPRLYWERSYHLSNWSTPWSPTQVQWKASWVHRLVLKASLRWLKFQE